ncbi:hypothetical protein F0562_005390 [Nyssa sinensis]|uniref:Protein kinase domain-containing protein n=1 Tax=Nyssa sinensis TaxID=561372 RepID=A0A5J5ALZ6_9ASTE|nr:hypothetical protein F0562_005390 [Nyssa sinensis]
MKPHLFFSIAILFSIVFLPKGKPDLATDGAALLALRSAVSGRSLLWNVSEPTPCSWPGVVCESGSVTELHLPGMGLSGQIPPNTIGNLTHLNTLSLRFNALSGPIPSDFASISGLRNLYLQGNLFSGPLPSFLFSLSHLIRLNLASNNFSGEISPAFNNLTRLGTLYLEHNQLTGSIPDLNLPSLQQFQRFVQSIDRKNSSKKADLKDVASVKQADIEIPPEKSVGDEDSLSTGFPLMAAATATKGGINVSESKNLVFFGKLGRAFDLEDLLRASAEVLGKGTFGTAYKAVLEAGTVMAVKRLKDAAVPEKEFREKIEVVGRMDHENLVPLRAYYYSRDEKLLVFDYMPMGSLSALLHGNKGASRTPLNWETSIKSSNVLLTKSYEARVSDFGLAHLVGPTSTPNRVAGYRAPEVTDARKVSQKADVYSFGVLLLELLTGKAPTHALLNDEGVDLPRWVQSVVREEWTAEVFDLELLRYQNVEEEMVQLLQLAIDCAAQYPDKRPSMAEVTGQIVEICHASLHQDPHSHMFNDAEQQA